MGSGCSWFAIRRRRTRPCRRATRSPTNWRASAPKTWHAATCAIYGVPPLSTLGFESLTMLPLVVTMGEPAGIGGEITLKAWLGRGDAVPPFYLIDDPARIVALARRFGWPVPVRSIGVASRASPAHPDPSDAPAILGAIETGVRHVLSGRAAALVTNPIHKDSLYRAGFRYPGHTEYLAALAGATEAPVMMLVCPGLRVVPVTIHLALRRAI